MNIRDFWCREPQGAQTMSAYQVVSRASGSSVALCTVATYAEAAAVRDAVEVSWEEPHEVVIVRADTREVVG